jgi:hypothetical protein
VKIFSFRTTNDVGDTFPKAELFSAFESVARQLDKTPTVFKTFFTRQKMHQNDRKKETVAFQYSDGKSECGCTLAVFHLISILTGIGGSVARYSELFDRRRPCIPPGGVRGAEVGQLSKSVCSHVATLIGGPTLLPLDHSYSGPLATPDTPTPS